jgi:ribosome maturation factor RimP
VGAAHAFSFGPEPKVSTRLTPAGQEEDELSLTTERVAELVAPVAERLGLELYDVDHPGGTLRVMLDRPGGIDVGTLAEATREISRLLDETNPIAGSYTLEVSSPGLERSLRTPTHFAAAVGERVKVKLRPDAQGERRVEGVLVAADDRTATIATDDGTRVLSIEEVARAHTVFVWDRSATSPRSPEATTESTEETR